MEEKNFITTLYAKPVEVTGYILFDPKPTITAPWCQRPRKMMISRQIAGTRAVHEYNGAELERRCLERSQDAT